MSTEQNESTGSSSSFRHELNDLPIGLLDIELSTPLTELVGDTTMFLLRPEQGPPAAVLKVARGLSAISWLSALECRAFSLWTMQTDLLTQ